MFAREKGDSDAVAAKLMKQLQAARQGQAAPAYGRRPEELHEWIRDALDQLPAALVAELGVQQQLESAQGDLIAASPELFLSALKLLSALQEQVGRPSQRRQPALPY